MDVTVVHTADLGPDGRGELRDLLDLSYAGDFEPADWEHALGGMHALARDDDGTLVGHAALVARHLLHGGRALRAGYVEAVAVHPEHRRRGIAGAVMDPVERLARGGYDVGALGSSEMALSFYAARGWRLWRGPLFALTPSGIVETPDERGGIHVLPLDVPLDLDGDLTCDWRDGDVW
ncbi:aminoglycoside 2'-N-acetyltransferase I [Pseudonocardia sediminis]|uniref:Aminoglycoside 2'-N-acetyltransferase I n=1 Tax=Pseudonocardia sediminis TaxID=1397368 RepID=A0A4Q7UU18_PSEST|nr:GNAT family N-acetyltransferase [Pseudonocardia sediminis]RZT85342.1 aminoglycoside 2'-N-acetyltransferase I [Pseudonocardia sediminis]